MEEKFKPLGHKAYGSIPHLPGSRIGTGDHHCEFGQAKIATEETRDKLDLIIVQEKLDGSNCSVAKIDNKIVALGRAGYLASSSPYKMHQMFSDWVEKNNSRFDKILNNGERISGEWLAMAHGTRYELKHEPFVVFDLFLDKHERLCYHDFLLRVLPQNFVVPHIIHIGQPMSIKQVMKRLDVSGHGALDKVEGAVWRIERNNKVDFLVKYVRPDKVDGCYIPENNEGVEVWNWKEQKEKE